MNQPLEASTTSTATVHPMETAVDPAQIMKTATAFWESKVLLTAVEFDLFSILSKTQMTANQLGDTLGIHPRGRYDFLDALVAAGFLSRDGSGEQGLYSNSANTDVFLNKKSEAYIGGIAEMLNARLFGFWNNLGEALRSGQAQNEIKTHGKPVFEELYADNAKLGQFLDAMSGFQAGNFRQLAARFNFSDYHSLSDIGGALGLLSCIIAEQHPHLHCNTFDLPPVAPHAMKLIQRKGLEDRVKVVSGDFFETELPPADIITMGNVLHDWNLENKKRLIQKAYDALPSGGAFIVIENLIDDDRRENLFGLLMSLNMLIETGDGFDYSGEDFRSWCQAIGFSHFEIIPLAGPTAAAVAYK